MPKLVNHTEIMAIILKSSYCNFSFQAHHGPYDETPKPYAYEYGVKDEYSGAYFDKKETQDEYGVVSGEYRQDPY